MTLKTQFFLLILQAEGPTQHRVLVLETQFVQIQAQILIHLRKPNIPVMRLNVDQSRIVSNDFGEGRDYLQQIAVRLDDPMPDADQYLLAALHGFQELHVDHPLSVEYFDSYDNRERYLPVTELKLLRHDRVS